MTLSISATDPKYHTANLPAWAQGYSFTETTPGTPQAYVGQCRVCKRGVRVMVTAHRQLRYENTRGMHGQVLKLKVTTHTVNVHEAVCNGNGKATVYCPTEGCASTRHGHTYRNMILCKAVEGHYSEGRRCDPRCTGATGPHCECSCGGANHGAAHSL